MYLIILYLFSVFSNIVAFLVTANYVPGFIIPYNTRDLFIAAFIFALINFFIRPLVKLIFSPIIFITLGLGIIAVNALMLVILDKLSDGIIIQGIASLLYATLLTSAINLIIHFAGKHLFKRA